MSLWYVAVGHRSLEWEFSKAYGLLCAGGLDWGQVTNGRGPKIRLKISTAGANYGWNNQLISIYKLSKTWGSVWGRAGQVVSGRVG